MSFTETVRCVRNIWRMQSDARVASTRFHAAPRIIGQWRARSMSVDEPEKRSSKTALLEAIAGIDQRA
jgi:hypothetical protein